MVACEDTGGRGSEDIGSVSVGNTPRADAGPRLVTVVGDAGRSPQAAADDAGTAVLTDAEVPDVQVPDAALQTSLPAWATPLLGQYVQRSIWFVQDSFGTLTRSEQISVSEFKHEGGGIMLRSRLCRAVGSHVAAVLTLQNPSVVAERIESVVLLASEQRWRTEGPTLDIGYQHAVPARCAGKTGMLVPKDPAQTWLSESSCRCASERDEPLVNDCRVLDPDADGHPGLTYALTGQPGVPGGARVFGVGQSDTHLVGGLVDASGALHEANVAASDKSYQLGCEPLGCSNIAVLGSACASSFNHAEFARLDPALAPDGGYTCEGVVAGLAAYFETPGATLDMLCRQQ